MINLAVFASGTGSNAVNLYTYFKDHASIAFHKIYCNNPKAGIIEKSKSEGIECFVFNKESWVKGELLKLLNENKTDFIVLAGFLWLVPADIIKAFPNRIINIHPALLPNYGGKGMYGSKVHESVIADKHKESGITIHLVNEEYDKGEILLQKKVEITEYDNATSLASKIHNLEFEYFPKTVEKYLLEYQ
ncbi:MAG: phosphoribosylglycinamide formyltransferase [Bacteroidia bacterium]